MSFTFINKKMKLFSILGLMVLFLFLSACSLDPRVIEMGRVSSDINKVSYVSDMDNYHVKEYYASPSEFYKNGGDCEDYSLAKYYKLKELGFDDNNMWLVSGQMKTYNGIINHSMLLVKLNNNKMYYLDNGYKEVLLTYLRKDFTPFFIYNKNGVIVLKDKKLDGERYIPSKNKFYNELMSVFNY